MDKKQIKELVIKTARIIDDKKAEDIKLYDLMGLSSLCDYMLIATAAASTHLEALEQEATFQLKEQGLYKINRDGADTGNWRISDYGGFMMHIMTKSAREFYALDKIFSFAKEVTWQEAVKEEVKKVVVKKSAAKKVAAKKVAKPAAKKAVKPAAKKVVKPAAKKAVKPAAKKVAAKKTIIKKASAKKVTIKKVVKPTTKKVAVKKVAAKAAKKTIKKTVKKVVKKGKK